MEQELVTILKKKQLRVTKPRLDVFRALSGSSKPLYIHDLVALCPTTDRVSIYRTIELFHQLHILEIIHTGWKKQYELVGPFKAHHHHLHCKNCDKIIEINSTKLEGFIDELSRDYSFYGTSHKFEVTGLCSLCR